MLSATPAASLRRLTAADFPASQVDAWVAQSGSGGERAGSGDERRPAREWVVAYTDPRREDGVARTLRARRFDAYVPAMTVTVRRADVARPLIPRYVFVGVRPGGALHQVGGTPGLEGLVRDADGRTARVDADVVAGLKQRQAEGGFDFSATRMAREAAAALAEAQVKKLARLVPGAPVAVVGGIWRSFRGVVAEIISPARLFVTISLFGRAFPVPMALDEVEPIVVADG